MHSAPNSLKPLKTCHFSHHVSCHLVLVPVHVTNILKHTKKEGIIFLLLLLYAYTHMGKQRVNFWGWQGLFAYNEDNVVTIVKKDAIILELSNAKLQVDMRELHPELYEGRVLSRLQIDLLACVAWVELTAVNTIKFSLNQCVFNS
jgi:hypothetical protein